MAHILLADDDIELSGMLVDYLAGEGFEVDVAHDGDTALSKALINQYDLLILDVMMPRRNGFDVLRELRTQSQLPVLMLTGAGTMWTVSPGSSLEQMIISPNPPIRASWWRGFGQS